MVKLFLWMEVITATPVMNLLGSVDRLFLGTFLFSCRYNNEYRIYVDILSYIAIFLSVASDFDNYWTD